MTDAAFEEALSVIALEGAARQVDFALRADGFRAAFADWRAPWSARAFADFAADPRVLWIEARRGVNGDGFVGLALARVIGDEAELLTIFRSPSVAGRGVGAVLIEQLICHLSEKKIDRLFLEVAENNRRAQSLYRRFGFKTVGERSGYYRRSDGGGCNALTLTLDFKTQK